MLDFNHILSTPGADIQTFYGHTTVTTRQWHTWRKPRGAKFIYMLGVGGGGSGGTGLNTAATSGGGGGGGSGAQTTVIIPAFMVPDILYVQAGSGGIGPSTNGAAGAAGTPTYICFEPNTNLNPNTTILFAGQGSGALAASATTGGAGGAAGSLANITNMPLAGRGIFTVFVGQQGTTGGASTPTVGLALTLPVTGLMVSGGTGGGGATTTGAAGGLINAVTGALGADFYSTVVAGGIAAVGATSAGAGNSGFSVRNYIMNYGGTGGGGATTTLNGRSGAGGDGAPGCGGGGGGGSNTTNNAIAKAGNGGPGFAYIVSI